MFLKIYRSGWWESDQSGNAARCYCIGRKIPGRLAAALPLWSEGGTQSTEITSSSHDDDDDEPLFIQCLPGRIAFLPRGHPSAQIFEAEIFFWLDDIGFYLFDSFVSKFDFWLALS